MVGDSREEVEDEIDFERVTLVAPDMCTEFAKMTVLLGLFYA